ncbi:large conductance mechanosensitive channel protein MscL [Neobacillus notoginsengisoli]|uniref:Large-conductance mechanosensitive channel n=1 Tax=Neobacillus notoginsengisoli TaxID=1578198 RepID=A0A417YW10_9BACI|nr:large conductance mechanosensitive channel protein MscL [Neobacillus notoginsengisoli]RHW41545.1 large conductance mechanosensitive channel protein MscL [Neobacillus notoginsengisoli]
MLQEFKKFAMKGNVMDLAVGVIVGAAFGKIVTSLVEDIMMPLIGLLMGGVNFKGLSFTFRKAEIHFGMFLQSVTDFVITAFSIFMFIKLINHFRKNEEEEEMAEVELDKSEELLAEIRDLLKAQTKGTESRNEA